LVRRLRCQSCRAEGDVLVPAYETVWVDRRLNLRTARQKPWYDQRVTEISRLVRL